MNKPKTFKEWAFALLNGHEFEQVGEPKTLLELELAKKVGLSVYIPIGMKPKTPIEQYFAIEIPSDAKYAVAGIAITGIATCGYTEQ